MLESEHGSGREHRDLLVVADGLESGAHGDFRLAIAHVAAEQAVHGLGRFHVALDVVDRGLLVFGLAEFEGVFELAHPFVVGREGMALGGLALGVELEQFVGHVLHGLAHARFGLGPGRRAQMVQYRLGPFRRTVLLHQVETRQRDIKTRAFGIFQQHEFRVAVALVDFLQPLVLPDAVLDVDHVVANLQVAEIGEKCRSLRFLTLGTRDHRIGLIEQIARAQNREVRVGKNHAIGHVGLGQRGGKHFAGEVGSFVGITFSAARPAAQAERHGVLAENVGQAFDFTGVRHGNQDALALPNLLLHFLEHGGNRAVEAGRRLGVE